MTNKYVAFDIETSKDIPGSCFDWQPHRPLGIACIASILSKSSRPEIWFSKGKDGKPSSQMRKEDVAAFVNYLDSRISAGFKPLTWNGLAFDYNIVAEESGLTDLCKQQALSHVDMMFHIVCEKGFPVSLNNAALGMNVQGKLKSVDGCDAPRLWAQGQHDNVIDYVAQDVRTTLSLGEKCDALRVFNWMTKQGKRASISLPRGWLSVKNAMKLPLPDTSWMSQPIERREYFDWLSQ